MGDVIEVVSQTKKTTRGLRTTEKEVPFHSSKQTKSGKASGSRHKSDSHTEGIQVQSSRYPPHDTEESHTLRFRELQEDDIVGFQTEDRQPQIDVCSKGFPTPWLQ
jgi:hypothetical protein